MGGRECENLGGHLDHDLDDSEMTEIISRLLLVTPTFAAGIYLFRNNETLRPTVTRFSE